MLALAVTVLGAPAWAGEPRTHDGFFSLGKEWWVGDSWGLGVAGSFGAHSSENFSGTSWAIRFSATLN